MSDIEIRAARLEDLDEVLALIQRDSMHDSGGKQAVGRAQYAKAFEAIQRSPNDELIVATLDGSVVGTLQLTFIPGLGYGGAWRAQVEGVRVQDDLRNQRIGTKLMEWVIARARERRCRLVQLTTNIKRQDAQRFYQRFGFMPSHVGMKLML